jgi:excisionase family DNA binding protein
MQKLLLNTTEAAQILGIGRTTLYDLIRTNRIRTVKVGARRLVPIDALPEAVVLLSEEASS